jgi:hypothetical protein
VTSLEALTFWDSQRSGHAPVADDGAEPDGEGLGSRIDASLPSVILLRREGERGASRQAGLLLANLDQVAADLDCRIHPRNGGDPGACSATPSGRRRVRLAQRTDHRDECCCRQP